MTKKTYITALKEIQRITVICKKCDGELHAPLNMPAPEQCPYCKRVIPGNELKYITQLQKALERLQESSEFTYQFQTNFNE